MTRLTLLLAFLIASSGAALAQTWQTPDESMRRYGVLTAACIDDPHGGMCLGVACPEGQLQLVSAAGGGGPMDGRTTIELGSRRAELAFDWDDRAITVLGIAASRAPIDRATLDAMATAPRVVLRSGPAGSQLTHRFATRNMARELQRIAAACPAR